MKKIKSTIHDCAYVEDLSLRVPFGQYIEIPEDIFESSINLKDLIKKGHIIFEGQIIRGKKVIFETGQCAGRVLPKTQQIQKSELQQLQQRIDTLQHTVGILSGNISNIQPTSSNQVYTSTAERYRFSFSSSDFNGLYCEDFSSDEFRDTGNPGTATRVYKSLFSPKEPNQTYSFISKTFECFAPIISVLAMADYRLEGGHISLQVSTNGTNFVTIIDTTNGLDLTDQEIDMNCFGGNILKVILNIHTNKTGAGATIESFGIMIRQKEETDEPSNQNS